MRHFIARSLMTGLMIFGAIGPVLPEASEHRMTWQVARERFPVDRLSAGDKAGVIALAAYVTANEGSGWRVDHMINTALAGKNVNFVFEFAAVASTKVRLHFIWTGPSYYAINYTDWKAVGPASYGQAAVSFSGAWPFAKGTYRLIVVAEQQAPFSGAECVAECNFRLY
jgi:hypothetical protein